MKIRKNITYISIKPQKEFLREGKRDKRENTWQP